MTYDPLLPLPGCFDDRADDSGSVRRNKTKLRTYFSNPSHEPLSEEDAEELNNMMASTIFCTDRSTDTNDSFIEAARFVHNHAQSPDPMLAQKFQELLSGLVHSRNHGAMLPADLLIAGGLLEYPTEDQFDFEKKWKVLNEWFDRKGKNDTAKAALLASAALERFNKCAELKQNTADVTSPPAHLDKLLTFHQCIHEVVDDLFKKMIGTDNPGGPSQNLS